MVPVRQHVELVRRRESDFVIIQHLPMVAELAVILVMLKRKGHAKSKNVQLTVVTLHGDHTHAAQKPVEVEHMFASDSVQNQGQLMEEKHVKDPIIKWNLVILTLVQFMVVFHLGASTTNVRSVAVEV